MSILINIIVANMPVISPAYIKVKIINANGKMILAALTVKAKSICLIFSLKMFILYPFLYIVAMVRI
jgi:hypothetical protein